MKRKNSKTHYVVLVDNREVDKVTTLAQARRNAKDLTIDSSLIGKEVKIVKRRIIETVLNEYKPVLTVSLEANELDKDLIF